MNEEREKGPGDRGSGMDGKRVTRRGREREEEEGQQERKRKGRKGWSELETKEWEEGKGVTRRQREWEGGE